METSTNELQLSNLVSSQVHDQITALAVQQLERRVVGIQRPLGRGNEQKIPCTYLNRIF
jgi:hypothetical protein